MPQVLEPSATLPSCDPAAVFAVLAAHHDGVFWLDAGPDADAGFSWIGWGEPDDPQHVNAAPVTGASAFEGGWVGWIGYEPGADAAGAPVAAPDADVPAELWLAVRGFVAFDHARHTAVCHGEIDVAEVARRRGDLSPGPGGRDEASIARSRHTPIEYSALIERCREAIRAGDAYQLCLTTRFDVDGEIDPIRAHQALRYATPAHHGGIIRSGPVALISASPERFLEVRGRTVRTHPIKGTRPRGRDAAADAALAAELVASPKERAENVMIVDLMRNDLSRVCMPGTVTVERLLEVESYPAVHQLVSTVSGRLPDATTVGELLAAGFPAGSMTGAPKLSAMTILHELERGPRGVFSGCFGWIGARGGLDLAMVIRSIVTHPGGAYVGAGGGITWLSDAAEEVAEVGLKARAPLRAVGAVPPTGW
ncbi:anthranilate synthase component I family protein [Microbacterium protaetiae]|uniref:Anthranilate synthase component I family protein n=1 Tax=Microbacterium protaetiae TaxID=2509458 RepID=A0A4P6EG42_9MICO|nr:anthranilate synthase component I family protein [Microbacterium protaetiae]QAY61372.1 anthranilate synthase component I family protein [Microbacterium protaetiae]